MSKSLKKILSVILVIAICFSTLATAVSAQGEKTDRAESLKSDITMQISTDKEKYKKNETANITVKLTNTSERNYEDVEVDMSCNWFKLDSAQGSDIEIGELKAGESKTVTFNVNYAKRSFLFRGIFLYIRTFFWILRSLWASYSETVEHEVKIGAVDYTFVFYVTGNKADQPSEPGEPGTPDEPSKPDPDKPSNPDVPENPNEPENPDEPEEVTYTVSFDLNYEGAENNIPEQTVKVGETATEPEEPTRDGFTFIAWYSDSDCLNRFCFSDEIVTDCVLYAWWAEGEKESITREEWIVALFDVMKFTADEYPFYSFDDSFEANDAKTIETAYRRGWFDLFADEDNMVYFNPTDVTTREFVAQTATNALLYNVSMLETPTWTDVSDAIYPLNDLQAVNSEILIVEDNKFKPQEAVTYVEMHKALRAIKAILESENVDNETEGYVNYAEGIEQTEIFYSLNEVEKKVYTINGEDVQGWNQGEIHVLISADGSAKDIAIKVTNIYEENGYTVIEYEEPLLEEVVNSFEVEGVTTTGAKFTPAEGITVQAQQQMARTFRATRASVSDTIPLWGPLTLKIDELDTEITFDLQNIEYRFAASPSWHLISIDEVYLALNSEISADWQIDDLEFEPDRVLLGNIDCPIGYGFNVSGEIYLTFEAEAGFDIVFTLTSKTGVQYTKNTGMRFINQINPNITPIKFAGEITAGAELEPSAEFLGIDLASVGAGVGVALEGEATPINVLPFEFCLDGTLFIYLNLYARIGPEDSELEFTKDIYNSDNSFYRKNLHCEETGLKEECTRGSGKYKGKVVRADDSRIPVSNAKIQVYRGNRLMDTTISDVHGDFVGVSLPSGAYKIVISSSGYIPYSQNFDIVGGEVTTLSTQLMISRDNEGEDGWDTRSCSGVVKNAYTGAPVSGVTIEVRTQYLIGNDDLIVTTITDSNGKYSFEAPIGKYWIAATKESYVGNNIYVTLFNDVNNANIVLNPENGVVIDGNLRTVLTWGYSPSDLDSHMVGPTSSGRFHVYYSDMSSGKVSLDVDDTSSYGPETVTIYETDSGVYSYLVHDFSNRHSNSSTAMSNSGAMLQLYNGNILMYTITIPTNQAGTVWHAFDYNSETGLITLVNEFSYQSDPEYVGR